MSIKFTRVDPVPAPLPPPTYSITGLSKQEATWLRSLIIDRNTVHELGEKTAFFGRLQRVIVTTKTGSDEHEY